MLCVVNDLWIGKMSNSVPNIFYQSSFFPIGNEASVGWIQWTGNRNDCHQSWKVGCVYCPCPGWLIVTRLYFPCPCPCWLIVTGVYCPCPGWLIVTGVYCPCPCWLIMTGFHKMWINPIPIIHKMLRVVPLWAKHVKEFVEIWLKKI